MIKKIINGSMAVGLLWLFMINPAWSMEYGYIHKKIISLKPSNLKPNTPKTRSICISCYDAWTYKLLDCAFTHKVIGLKEPYIGTCKECIENNGGHVHDYDSHPLGKLKFDNIEVDVNNKDGAEISGQTQNHRVVIEHQMPEVAGKIVTETIISAPSGWRCAFDCFTTTSSKYESTLEGGVRKLEELPGPAAPGEHYEKCRSEACPDDPLPGVTVTHPEGHYGTHDTIKKLKKIGEEYYKLSGRILSVNDISLPMGGLFCFKNAWEPPHKSHRTGTDADINQKGIPCYENDKLREAVKNVAGEQPYPILRCEVESGEYCGELKPECKYYHIDFD